MMETAIGVLLFAGGTVFGALLAVAFLMDRQPLLGQFNEIHHSRDNVEQRARRVQ